MYYVLLVLGKARVSTVADIVLRTGFSSLSRPVPIARSKNMGRCSYYWFLAVLVVTTTILIDLLTAQPATVQLFISAFNSQMKTGGTIVATAAQLT